MSKTKKRAAKKAAAVVAAGPAVAVLIGKPKRGLPKDVVESITAFYKRGQWEEALKALEALRAAGQEPSAVLVNKIICCCGKAGYWQKVRRRWSPQRYMSHP